MESDFSNTWQKQLDARIQKDDQLEKLFKEIKWDCEGV